MLFQDFQNGFFWHNLGTVRQDSYQLQNDSGAKQDDLWVWLHEFIYRLWVDFSHFFKVVGNGMQNLSQYTSGKWTFTEVSSKKNAPDRCPVILGREVS